MIGISVIVPVYNIEEYLPKCIESVLMQTYKSFELILVDDGSTDNSGKICDEYAAMDSRIIVIHKLNGGQSSARNIGIDIARGEWISFVDGDDWIEPEMYQDMLSIAESDDDFICCSHYDVYDGDRNMTYNSTSVVNRFSKKQIFDELFSSNHLIRFEAWNKLFRRSVINEIRFKEGQLYEEVYFDRMVFLRSRQCVCLDIPYYNYRRRRIGSTATFFNEKKMFIFDELIEFSQDLLELGLTSAADACILYAFETALSFFVQAKQFSANDLILISIEKYIKKIRGMVKKLPMRLRIQYLLYSFSHQLFYHVKLIKK